MKTCDMPECVCGHGHCNFDGKQIVEGHYFVDATRRMPCRVLGCSCRDYQALKGKHEPATD